MSKTIYELSNDVLCELEEQGHSKLTRDNFRYFWNGMARYFESKGVCEFDINVAMEYFEMRCTKRDFKKRSESFIRRAILLLDHYSKYGTIPLRCYTPISKLHNLDFIELLNNYGESLVSGEYLNRTIEGYLRYASCFLQFAEQKEYYNTNNWSADTTWIPANT